MTSASLAENRRRPRLARRPTESIRPAMPRPQRRDCHGKLASALVEAAGPDCLVADASFRPWCSATFLGAQHRIALRVEGPASRAEALAERLGEAELRVPGHIVADIAVDGVRAEVGSGEAGGAKAGSAWLIDLVVLTIEDW